MELAYTITYSKRRTLTITVERDRSIVVNAPLGTSAEKIERILQTRKAWLYEKTRHPRKYTPLPHAPGKELVAGESMLYLGKLYRVELIQAGDEIRLDQCFRVPQKTASKEAFHAWYLRQAREIVLPRVAKLAGTLGVKYNEAKVGSSKYRWGSCTPKDNIVLNWRLIKAPLFVVDYVIVHELAHLLESNHTARFWNILRAQSPNMEKAKVWLQQHGSLLEQEL